jgi:hypothetical protein
MAINIAIITTPEAAVKAQAAAQRKRPPRWPGWTWLRMPARCLWEYATDTIQASNSLEMMLAHQMGVAHTMAMKFAADAQDELCG